MVPLIPAMLVCLLWQTAVRPSTRRPGKPSAKTSQKSAAHKKAKSPLLAKDARNGAPAASGRPTSLPGKHFLSDKVGQFTESVIREMTRQAMLHGAVNSGRDSLTSLAPS